MAATEREKLEKEITALTSKRDLAQQKAAGARQRHQELGGRRSAFLARLADAGADDAVRERLALRDCDATAQEALEDAQAHEHAAIVATEQLVLSEKALARAQRQEAVDSAETQIEELSELDGELDAVLLQVHQKLDAFLAGAAGIGDALSNLDPTRFCNTGSALQEEIRRAVLRKFLALGKGVEASEDSFATARHHLQSAIATLRYSLIDGDVRPAPGERLFIARVACPGVRGVDLRIGDKIALRDDEAAPFLEHRSIERLPAA